MLWLKLFCSLLFPAIAYAQDDVNGTFFNPPSAGDVGVFNKNPAYKIGDTLQVRWQTDFANISLVLWQYESEDFEYLLRTHITAVIPYVHFANQLFIS